MQLRIYIAGPHRARTYWLQEQNVRMAEGYSLAVWGAGHVPICPHTQIRNYHDSLGPGILDQGTLTMLEGCHAVLVLPGWQDSKGTCAEIEHAERFGIPLEHATTTSILLHIDNLVRKVAALEGDPCIQR